MQNDETWQGIRGIFRHQATKRQTLSEGHGHSLPCRHGFFTGSNKFLDFWMEHKIFRNFQ